MSRSLYEDQLELVDVNEDNLTQYINGNSVPILREDFDELVPQGTYEDTGDALGDRKREIDSQINEGLNEEGDVQKDYSIRFGKVDDNPLPEIRADVELWKSPTEVDYTRSETLMMRYVNEYKRIGDFHIDTYNHWIVNTAKINVESRVYHAPDGTYFTLKFIPPTKPYREVSDGSKPMLTPQFCRENGLTYGTNWYAKVVHYDEDDNVLDTSKNAMFIGNIPIMLKSSLCHLQGKTDKELFAMGEDPYDPSGYFIIGGNGRGNEYTVLLYEQLGLNKFFTIQTLKGLIIQITANTSRGTVVTKLATSKKSNILKICIASMKTSKAKKHKCVNVLRVFRFFGMHDFMEIEELISSFIRPENRKKAMFMLSNNFVNFESVDLPQEYSNNVADHSDISYKERKANIRRFIKPEDQTNALAFLKENPDGFDLQDNDIEYMIKKMKKTTKKVQINGESKDVKRTEKEKIAEIEKLFYSDLFPHVNTLYSIDGETEEEYQQRIIDTKLNMLAMMIARYIETQAGLRDPDDRDSWSSKRIKGAGELMEQLYRNAFRQNFDSMASEIAEGNLTTSDEIALKFTSGTGITTSFNTSFVSSKWGAGSNLLSNIAQQLVRNSPLDTADHVTKIDVKISRKSNSGPIREVGPTQYGFVCPVTASESDSCGLVKATTIITRASLNINDELIIRDLVGDKGRKLKQHIFPEQSKTKRHKHRAMVNGKYLGWCDGEATKEYIIGKRRSSQSHRDVGVILTQDWLHVECSPGRLMRPVLIMNIETQVPVITEKDLWNESFDVLFEEGAMEYMSVWEQEYIKIAPTIEDVDNRTEMINHAETILHELRGQYKKKKSKDLALLIDNAEDELATVNKYKPYTHLEIDPQVMLGVSACLIPYANCNQAPRNTYQAQMGKQALGTYHLNHKHQYYGMIKKLMNTQQPMLSSGMYDVLGMSARGPGSMINCAFMAYPSTEEDAFVFNADFLNSGGFRIIKYLECKATFTYSTNVKDNLTKPPLRANDHEDLYAHLEDNGLPKIGAYLDNQACVIGKMQQIKNESEPRNESVYLSIGDSGVVDNISITNNPSKSSMVVIVRLKIARIPQVGDKFAPRNAQKGTNGRVEHDRNMPFSSNGITPDVIVNTTTIPTRMTISYLIELFSCKAAAFRGTRINGGAFRDFEFDTHRETLREYSPYILGNDDLDVDADIEFNVVDLETDDDGLIEFGYEPMYSGLSGQKLTSLINVGPCFFQALRHHVADKQQSRSEGGSKSDTHQPVKGRRSNGGLRVGGMELNGLVSHSASETILERFMHVSDGYDAAYCGKCGEFAVNQFDLDNKYICIHCDEDSHIGSYRAPFALKLFKQILGGMSYKMVPKFITDEELLEKLYEESSDPELLIEETKKQLNITRVSDHRKRAAESDNMTSHISCEEVYCNINPHD